MTNPTTYRKILLSRAAELFGGDWVADHQDVPTDKLEALIAEAELARDFWSKQENENPR